MKNKEPKTALSNGKNHAKHDNSSSPTSYMGQIAGSPATVAICFADSTINQLFSQLLEVRGISTEILENIKQVSGNTKIITEPQFFESLDEKYHQQCLLVGNKGILQAFSTLSLSRPLTEGKIEAALTLFLEK